MAKHFHKAFSGQQVRALLGRYVGQEIKLEHILGVLKDQVGQPESSPLLNFMTVHF